MGEYIEKQKAIDNIEKSFDKETILNRFVRKIAISAVRRMKPADVVSWAYLERYANWFCADVSFPEFIREAKAFLGASGGFQEGSEIYG